MTKTVLITGGLGYIGAHAAKVLKNAGYLPVAFDNLSFGHKEFAKWGPYVLGDLKDKDALDAAFSKYRPSAVMHFAASALVSESVTNPAKYYENNLISTINLLNKMVEYRVDNLVFSSTCATYGVPQTETISEDHPQSPINPYGQSKLMIETMLKDYEKAYGLRSAILRYFNAAGADTEGEIGENHTPETHLIPLTIQTALKQRDQIEVFGTDFDTKDGSCIRDYIHVLDLARAHLKALEHITTKKESLKLNLGTGRGYSVLDVIEMVKTVSKSDFKIVFSKRREGDPPILVADSSKAKIILNFEPKFSDLETIISSAFSWHQNLLMKKAALV